MNDLIRKNIRDSKPYKAGKPIEETRRELGVRRIIKLASNENPLGPSPKALEAIQRNIKSINRYPDSQGFYLKEKLARQFSLRPDNFVLGNGSDELIDTIIKTFVENDEHIITAAITFLEYEIIAKVNAKKVVLVPLRGFTYDLKEIQKKINSKTKLIFIANPNNPTGTYVDKNALGSFIKALPRRVLLVLDEAYDTFIDAKDYASGTEYLKKYNVLTLKTFSKAYGLAGLRIGYCVAPSRFTPFMEKVRQPFNVNLLAQAAAIAALEDGSFLTRTRAAVLEGKRFLYCALQCLGISYVPSAANFILIDTGKNGVAVFRKMLLEGVIVRDMEQYGLKNFIRVTIGTMDENRKFIASLTKVLNVPRARGKGDI